MQSLMVGKNEAGQRLDKLLSKYLSLAGKGFLYKMMRKKNIVLNGKKCDGSEKLKEGDEIKLFLSDETIEKFSKDPDEPMGGQTLDIIYENPDILLINKPVGMLSQKAREQDQSLVEYVTGYLIESGQLTREEMRSFRPSVCNRLDRNTSGLVIAGKSLAGLQIMSEVIKTRRIQKFYQCIVVGELREGQRITGFLKKDERTNQVFVSTKETPDSARIVTEYRPIQAANGFTLLEVELITGRTHQIRAHLASIGHPIVGDYKYGNKTANEQAKKQFGIQSQLLHSWRLIMPELPKPLEELSGRVFTAPIPAVFRQYFPE